MSKEKIEKILATYPPVKGNPGYVWFNDNSIVKLETLREAYKEHFAEDRNEKKEHE